MPSQLIKNDAVSFVCLRDFVFNGVQYGIGTDFPQEAAGGRIEVLVRTRRVAPVVDSTDVKPRHWHREVRLRADLLERLGQDPKMPPPLKKVEPKPEPKPEPKAEKKAEPKAEKKAEPKKSKDD